MGDRGLRGSKWAPGNDNGSFMQEYRQHDEWKCSYCDFSNYQWREVCLRCKAARHNVLPKRYEQSTSAPLPERKYDSSFVATYNSSSAPLLMSVQHAPAFKPIEKGLATSCWAPRDQHGMNYAQVWTRTVPTISKSRTPSPSRSKPPPPSQAPDLGLPYQVQHYILATIQRILEEGCYEFAHRWTPQVLSSKGWDCFEAVELSTWRTFLPTALPPTAIKPLSKYTLEAALGDAVRIRNAAVHRHLCDNSKVRKMALQAQDLMSMFSDTTRQNKFHQLWLELNTWDLRVKEAGHTSEARSGLERSLQEISERPLDDMDWTPNAVSLEEVHEIVEPAQTVDMPVPDQMDLD